ncbi:hypothetical protein [Williamsia herbipolensis]|uniref:hypothetical protein n=1 Tax=Williamsia herbipolensis TaxID=1603258 RepID=UPI0005F84615|nr:hypothetical protein [Williamsia herbipolensis]
MNLSHTTSAHHHPAFRRVLVVCGTLAVLAVATGCGDDSAPSLADFAPDRSQVSQIPPIPAITPIACDPSSAAPGETVTRGRGDHDSGIGAVANYHWSVITARDSTRAADAVAQGAAMGRPQNLSDALAGFPPGTTYCLRLRQTDPSTVLFTLDYKPPSGADAEYKMRATVTGAPGAVRVAGEVEQ